MTLKVIVSNLRPWLTKLLDHVELGDIHMKFTRHRNMVAMIVLPIEFERMSEAMEDEVCGTLEEDGRRPGSGLVRSWTPSDIMRVRKLKKPPLEGRARNWFWHW